MLRMGAMLILVLSLAVSYTPVVGQPSAPTTAAPATSSSAPSADYRQVAPKLIEGGIKYLLSQREADGGWSLGKGAAKPAITAMALKALMQGGYDASNEIVAKGFDVLLSYRQADGGVYDPKQGQENYTTAIAVMALSSAHQPQYKPALDAAVKYLRGLQIVPGSESPDGRKVADADPRVGGVGYGEHGRPDLSNLGMWMEAMHEAGVPGDDPAMQRALAFVTSTQNRSETNAQPWAKLGSNDGGFIYAPMIKGDANTGESKAEGEGTGLRSYGSMTYTGFKSMLYAAVDRNDGRVQAALKWIRTYWQLDSNPNMPASRSVEGLFYYYHVFAKAMAAWGQPVINDIKGRPHDWRQELTDELARRVKGDGSWENESARWYERLPVLSTCYSVLALEVAMGK